MGSPDRTSSTRHAACTFNGMRRDVHDESPAPAGKLREIVDCPTCGASYRSGRWTWETAPVGSFAQICPACERIERDDPAGVLSVEGAFASSHRREVITLVHAVEERERTEHALKRVMAIEEEGRLLIVKTTDAELTEALGKALEKAFAGKLVQPAIPSDKANRVRVHWASD